MAKQGRKQGEPSKPTIGPPAALEKVTPSSAVRSWAGAVLICLSLLPFIYVKAALLTSPPAAQISTDKGSKVNGINGGKIEIGSSVQDPLALSFATEAHVTGSAREAYAFEVRAPKSRLIDCDDSCTQDLVLELAFSGSADGARYQLDIDDLNAVGTSFTHVAYTSSSGAIASAVDRNSQADVALEDIEPRTSWTGTVFQIHIDPNVMLSRPADASWTSPIVRFVVTPKEDNAKASGPYFALVMPNVVTISSAHRSVVTSPFSDGGLVLNAVSNLSTKFGLVDETGAAQLSGTLDTAGTWGVNPGSLPTGAGPVVSYVDHRVVQEQEMWRQLLLLLAATLAGAGAALLLEVLVARIGRKVSERSRA